MNNAIFDELLNDIFDAKMYQESKNLGATARDTVALWRALADTEEDK
jgi:hypothetical protein